MSTTDPRSRPLPADTFGAIDQADHSYLAPLFLGPSGENGDLMEALLTGFLRDHVYWRRNFHPEDPPTISVASRSKPGFLDSTVRLEQALFKLCADLKRSTPSFAPRYIGHMVSDPLLPALLGQIVTTLYNPNNIAKEAAPVTLDLELKVGRQLAIMLGMNPSPKSGPRAWGHITSGGTVANFEALWLLRTARFFPLALAAALRTMRQVLPEYLRNMALPGQPPIVELDSWALMNLSVTQALDLNDTLAAGTAALNPKLRDRLDAIIRAERFEQLGPDFFSRHNCTPPLVLAPTTAHYSWSKAMTVLGIGRNNLRRIPADAQMRMDCSALEDILATLQSERRPVLAIIGVLGTTEFGTVDPLHRLVILRKRFSAAGMHFAVHVDAAWGGYLSTLFRRPDASFRARSELCREFRYFPTPSVHQSFRAVANADTVTVDPHKLGYVTYGAGALVASDHRLTTLVGERPAYVYDQQGGTKSADAEDRLQELGDYILEGTKPGAAAAAAWLTHSVVPLNHEHFGRLCRQTVRANEDLYDNLKNLAHRLAKLCHLSVPVEPDTNLICLALNPVGNRTLAKANEFGRNVYRHLCVDALQPVQTRQFIGSHTSILRRSLSADAAAELAEKIGVSAESFVPEVSDPATQADHVFLIRHTLMNPWLRVSPGDGQNYLDRYCDYLASLIEREFRAWTVHE